MESIGKYTNLERLGRGAMGVVYRAYDSFLDRTVAIKMMSTDLDAEPHFRERFFREARVAVQLSHPNIVKIHDLAEDQGRAYIVMEFLDGENLGALIDHSDTVPLETRLKLMKELSTALAYAHDHDVVHRDIKPGNIQVTASGHAKILDFGLARITDSTMTATGAVLGTPSYMSPEQVGGQKVGHHADMFALGAVFYELLTGRRAFIGDSIADVFRKISNEDPPPVHELDSRLPEELSAIVGRAMAKKPEDRYPTMRDLAADLERFEQTLAGLRKEALGVAETAVRRLEELRERHRDLLARPQPADDPAATQVQEGPGSGDPWTQSDPLAATVCVDVLDVEQLSMETLLELDLPDGYLELQAVARLADDTHRSVEALVKRLEWVMEREGEPLEEASDGHLRGTLAQAQDVLAAYPRHPATEALCARLLEELDRRLRQQRLAELVDGARGSYEAGDAEAALAALAEALEIDASHPEAASLRQRIETELEEQRQRRERARQVLQALADARESLANGDPVTARVAVEKALGIDPGGAEAASLLAEVKRAEEELREKQERQRDIEGLLENARKLADAGREEEAVARLDELLEREPEHERGLALRREIERHMAIREQERRRQEEERQRREEERQRREAEARQLREQEERQRLEEEAQERQARIDEKLRRARSAMQSGELENVLELAASVLEDDAGQRDALELRERARAALAELRQQQAELLRQSKETQAAREAASAEPPPSAGVQSFPAGTVAPSSLADRLRESPARLAAAVAAVVLLAVLGWALWPAADTVEPGEPVDPRGRLVVDASPWGRIVRIVDAEGNEVTVAADASTPYSAELPPGTYTIELQGPDGGPPRTVSREVRLDGAEPVFERFATVGAEDYFRDVGW